MRTPRPARLLLPLAAAAVLVLSPALAHFGGAPDSGGAYVAPPDSKPQHLPRGEKPCPAEHPEWRDAQVVEGVSVRASDQCLPDDPRLVAAVVKGTNNVPASLLEEIGLHPDAVVKHTDRDGDGDPDVTEIALEVLELNGWLLSDDTATRRFPIAPGVEPGLWVFAPKTQGIDQGPAAAFIRPPGPAIRVEQGDEVRIRLENTHYFPHTIHLHGTDHPFVDEGGEGNDGVPHGAELGVMPGKTQTYDLTPRVPGTMWYHCHVQPQVHVQMGLAGMIVIEPNLPNNPLQTLNVGGGEVRFLSEAVAAEYDQEYDLQYSDIDGDLNDRVKESSDPRVLQKRMHREYEPGRRGIDFFLLNGKSFPYTMQESLVVVDEGDKVKLRVLVAGSHPISLHTHGHKVTETHSDGVPVPEAARMARDTVWIGAAQRADLDLEATNDGFRSYGPGAWMMHDHQEEGVTTGGIEPGGAMTLITYPAFLDNATHLPTTVSPEGWKAFFTKEYWRGQIPVFHDSDPDGELGDPLPVGVSTMGDGMSTGGRSAATSKVLGLVTHETAHFAAGSLIGGLAGAAVVLVALRRGWVR